MTRPTRPRRAALAPDPVVAASVRAQLLAAGVPWVVAEPMGDVHGLVVASLVARGGPDAAVALARQRLTITREAEPLGETVVVAGIPRPTRNSEGRHIAPTVEAVTRFWEWFGDSQLVDHQERPLVLYHGTPATFDAFSTSLAVTGGESAAIFAQASPESIRAPHRIGYGERFKEGVNVLPLYGRMQSPLQLTTETSRDFRESQGLSSYFPQIITERDVPTVRASGYDGIIYQPAIEGAAPELIFLDATQLKSAIGNRGTFNGQTPSLLHQPAYHGSPYHFDRFSLAHAGRGEGVHAYGYGLYFASRVEVAEWYKAQLERGVPGTNGLTARDIDLWLADGTPVGTRHTNDHWYRLKQVVTTALRDRDRDGTAAPTDADADAALRTYAQRELARDTFAQASADYQAAMHAAARGALHWAVAEPGQVYAVDIPEDDTLLNWDAPLAEQPPLVQAAIATLRGGPRPTTLADVLAPMDVPALLQWAALFDPHSDWPELVEETPTLTADTLRAALAAAYAAADTDDYLAGGPTDRGETIYLGLAMTLENHYWATRDTTSDPQQEVSRRLRALGVRGIRYRDSVTRGAETGTDNFVIFDDADVTIVDTLYQGDPLAPRGRITFDGAHVRITLLPGADTSTVVHESAHGFLEQLRTVAALPGADAGLRADLETLATWAGASAGGWNVASHERVARAFERYLGEGVAPTPALAPLFAASRTWITEVYGDLTALGTSVPPAVSAVFDRLLAGQAPPRRAGATAARRPRAQAVAAIA